jgi:hypothetical protein
VLAIQSSSLVTRKDTRSVRSGRFTKVPFRNDRL